MRISSKGLINVTAPTAGGKGEVRATHGEQSVGRELWEALTPGESPCQQWDVVAPAPGAGVQVVPQLVVGGEIDDCGWHSHHPGRKRAVRAARGGGSGWESHRPDPHSQRGGEPAPQGPDALVACDLHKGILWGERSTQEGQTG